MKKPRRNRSNVPETVPVDNLITLPDSVHILPINGTVRVTRSLWRSLIRDNRLTPHDEILDDLATYLAFGLLGFVGYEHKRAATADSLMIPIATQSGRSVMCLTVQRRLRLMTLSLPGELILTN